MQGFNTGQVRPLQREPEPDGPSRIRLLVDYDRSHGAEIKAVALLVISGPRPFCDVTYVTPWVRHPGGAI